MRSTGKLIEVEKGPQRKKASEFPVGTLLRLVGVNEGRIVLRTYTGLVQLTDSVGTDWDAIGTRNNDAIALPAGSVVELTAQ